jgi:glutamate carboxypeptidase
MALMADLSPLEWIDSQYQHMVHLTESWSRINSGSYHIAGLARMLKALEDNFHWLGGTIEKIDLEPLKSIDAKGEEVAIPLGQALRIRKRPEAPIQVFLGGHMDTVFSRDHPFQIPAYLDENTLNGPGVADLKGGLVVMLKALEAFERSPQAQQLGWEVLINPDEEIGSQSSDYLLKEAAERNHFGLVYEPALANGTLAGARKGSGNFTLVVYGKAAHAGREFDKGRNAIVAASKLAVALDGLNGQRDGLTLNIGKVEGGGALNVVPDLALLRFNVRIVQQDDREWLMHSVETLIAQLREKEPDFVVRLHGRFTRAPKPMSEANERLFQFVRDCGAQLGMDIQWQATGGCCDGNNLWEHGLPNVDTLGVRGAHIHSDKEMVYLESLTERARLSAFLLMKAAEGNLKF